MSFHFEPGASCSLVELRGDLRPVSNRSAYRVRASCGRWWLIAFFASYFHIQQSRAEEEVRNSEGDAASEQTPPKDEKTAQAAQAPQLLFDPSPRYPENYEGERGKSYLFIVHISAVGEVLHSDPLEEMPQALVQIAEDTIASWRFSPAVVDGKKVDAQIRILVAFADFDPSVETEPGGEAREQAHHHLSKEEKEATEADTVVKSEDSGAVPAQKESSKEPSAPEAEQASFSFEGEGNASRTALRDENRSGMDVRLERRIFNAAALPETSTLLNSVPGVFSTSGEGGGTAQTIFLRGFDAEHGQDIEFLMDGIPLNQVSHIHGQGYSDLNFMIPEVIRSISAIEGVHDPRQGNFAIAGTINFELGVDERGIHSYTSAGSFGTVRQSLVWAPVGMSKDTFGAAAYRSSAGFGQNRAGNEASGQIRYGFDAERWHFRLGADLRGARYDSAGVVRVDDVSSGKMGFYDVYPYTTAEAQNASNTRASFSFHGEERLERGENTSFDLWLNLTSFQNQANFTGFLESSTINASWVGRGDLIQQSNEDLTIGAQARHRFADYIWSKEARGGLEVGAQLKYSSISQTQNLVEAPKNNIWDTRVDADVREGDIGTFIDFQSRFWEKLDVRLGLRADALMFQVDDKLGNYIPPDRPETYLPGYTRSSMGFNVGPRISANYEALSNLSLSATFGQGFRSPQARMLQDNEKAPFTDVYNGDIGVDWAILDDELLRLKSTAFVAYVEQDVAFEPETGTLQNIGPTTRLGANALLRSEWDKLFVGQLSTTLVHATLDAAPVPTTDNPTPAYQNGQLLPYVPPLVIRVDLAYTPSFGKVSNKPLLGHFGLGYSYLAPRPLPYSSWSSPLYQFDVKARLSWDFVALALNVVNVFNRQNAGTEYSYVSNWEPTQAPSRIPVNHTAAASPLAFLVTLEFHL